QALPKRPAELKWTLAWTETPNAESEEEASVFLRCAVKDPDPKVVGRAFSSAAVELALASYPGFHVTAPPGDGSPYGVFHAGYVAASAVPHVAALPDGTRVDIAPATDTGELPGPPDVGLPEPPPDGPAR